MISPERARGLRRVWLRVTDAFPWRPLAWLVAAAAYVAIAFLAYEQLDLVFLVVGYGAAGLLALSTVFTLLAAAWVKWELRRVRSSEARVLGMETQRDQPSGFVMRDFRWLPLVRVDWGVIDESERAVPIQCSPQRALGKARERIRVPDRGEFGPLRRRVIVEDVFGFCRLGLYEREPLQLEVLPHVGALGRLPVLTTFAGGEDWPHPMGVAEGDRVELRRYAPGDPARFIHWKVFSRTRKLMVRMPERALTRARRTIAYLVAGRDDDATAASARVAVDGLAFGDEWTFAADGSDATQSIAEANAAIVRSAAHREAGAVQLQSFVTDAERSGPAAVVVFAPPTPGPWLERVTTVVRARPGRCRVVIAVDGLAPPERRGWRWWLVAPPETNASSVEALDEVVAALSKVRVDVLVLDRRSGQVLSEAHRLAARRLGAEARTPRAGAKSKAEAA